MSITIYSQGESTWTASIDIADADTQIAAGGGAEFEARALKAFHYADTYAPATLLDGALTLVDSSSDDEGCDQHEYVETSDLVAEAEDYLDATWDNGAGRLVYYDEAMSMYYVCEDRKELVDLALMMRSSDPEISRDAYSHWCAGTSHYEVDLRRMWIVHTESGADWLIEDADDERDAERQYLGEEYEEDDRPKPFWSITRADADGLDAVEFLRDQGRCS